MSIRPSNAAIALVVVLVGILLTTLVPQGPFRDLGSAEAASASYSYAENGTAAVATFTATDPDGDPIVWSLGGTDNDKDAFTITGGALTFKKSPDFEVPHDTDTNNVYTVTVIASGGELVVTVTVTNVDEAGAVSLDKPQPQAGRMITATLTDEDGIPSGHSWQWSKSTSASGPWTAIAKATNAARSPAADDVGYYLRATVTYTDGFGSGKTASAVTANTVEAKTLSNAKPSFKDQDDRTDTGTQVNRSVYEGDAGMAVGKPVTATDPDGDILIYTLSGTDAPTANNGANAKFEIDSATGQIKTKVKLNFEADGGDEDNCVSNDACVVTVTATDPSGAYMTQDVNIEIKDANEPPAFNSGTNGANAVNTLYLEEADANEQLYKAYTSTTVRTNIDSNAYSVLDPDGADTADPAYSLEGADAKFFDIGATTGNLIVVSGNRANYEEKKSYSITVVASTGADKRKMTLRQDVTVNVIDMEDEGSITLSQIEPQVGVAVIATLTDPDGGVAVSEWQWWWENESNNSCSDFTSGGTQIIGATSSTYTPKEEDVTVHNDGTQTGRCLRAQATYTDNIGTASTNLSGVTKRGVQTADPANAAPVFPDQDQTTPGDQSDSTTRTVAENTPADQSIGSQVEADDADALLYTLSGADADSFSVDRESAHIKTKAALDYETKNVYTVTLTATDPSGATDSIAVTINVTDDNDVAVISGGASHTYAENGTAAVATFTATDADGDAIAWSLEGDDAADFTITGGVLAFKSSPNYEDADDQDANNVYMVTVKATDGMMAVTVTVTNVDEAGAVSLDKPQPQAGRTLTATLADEDGGVSGETWQWSRGASATGPWFAIQNATTQARPPTSDDVNSYLRATVTYTDAFGSGKTATAVSTNAVEARTLSNSAPSFKDQDDRDDTGTQVNRKITEGAAGSMAGKPVTATDADGDILIYTLSGTDAPTTGAKFEIDSASGQIKSKVALDREAEDGDPDNCAAENACVVVVKATDPSGASTTQTVNISIEDANEAPYFSNGDPAGSTAVKTLWLVEGTDRTLYSTYTGVSSTNVTLPGSAYAATDPDDEVGADATITYSLEGADGKLFGFTDGTLSVPNTTTADYEEKNSYSITVVASSGVGVRKMSLRQEVTINVVDAEDDGSIILSQREPQEGVAVVATLTDPDGGVTVKSWKWYRADQPNATNCENTTPSDSEANAITGATSSTYTPVAADVDKCLDAKAVYTDNIGTGDDSANKVADRGAQEADPANTAPAFPDQDATTPGDQSDSTTRTVAENTPAGTAIGSAVDAVDTDLLMYTLSGADADSFTVVRSDGQIKTKAALDYETKKVYMVTVTATDPSGATDSIAVTINVTDVDDGATIIIPGGGGGTNSAPTFGASSASRSVAENTAAGTAIGAPVMATDADGDALTYSVSGADSSSFTINTGTGQLMTSAALDYETKSSYSVTVAASDGTASATIAVTITVTDADEAGFDLNGNGTIERNEVISAIGSYLGGTGGVQRSDVIGLIGRYLSGN